MSTLGYRPFCQWLARLILLGGIFSLNLDIRSSLKDNPKRFWTFHKINNPSKIPHSITYNNSTAHSPADQANLFNKYFHSVFRDKTTHKLDFTASTEVNSNNLCSIDLSTVDVFEVLSSVDPGKASGPDGIPGKVLRECASELSPYLTPIFIASLSQGMVPFAWKLVNVTPVFKKDDVGCADNTGLQPKSIWNKSSQSWLILGHWVQKWGLKMFISSCFKDTQPLWYTMCPQ